MAAPGGRPALTRRTAVPRARFMPITGVFAPAIGTAGAFPLPDRSEDGLPSRYQ